MSALGELTLKVVPC